MSARAPARPRPGADPRIEARREAVVRSARRTRLRRTTAGIALACLLAVGALGTRSPLLDLDELVLVGASHTSPAQVRAATGLHVHMPMLSVNTGRARALLGKLPWVRGASVRRRWPGTVVVTLSERDAVAALARPGRTWLLVDGTGRVLAAVADPPRGLPHIHGATRLGEPGSMVPPKERSAVRVAAALSPFLESAVGGINIEVTGIELGLHAGGVVRLGRPERVGEKLRAAETVLSRVGVRRVDVLDVRVPLAPVLTRR